jgi:hypothetical protein
MHVEDKSHRLVALCLEAMGGKLAAGVSVVFISAWANQDMTMEVDVALYKDHVVINRLMIVVDPYGPTPPRVMMLPL